MQRLITNGFDRLERWGAHFAAETRGNVAMMFALSLPVLLMVVLGGVDISRLATVKANVQDALDAATLAAARSPYIKEDELTQVGLEVIRANLQGYSGVTFDDKDIVFKIDDGKIIIADVRVQVDTLVANIVLPPYGKIMDDTVSVSAHSEVNRAMDVEVALVLDITGSMKGSRLTDLQRAANDLVAAVVQPSDSQGVTRTRVALVPYSMGVNAGDYADQARGEIRGPSNISSAEWASGSAKTVSGVSKGGQTVVQVNNHGLATNDYVWLTGVSSNGSPSNKSLASRLNNRAYRVVRVDAHRLRLEVQSGSNWDDYSTSGYNNYQSGGTVRQCLVSTCEVVVNSPSHGLQSGEAIRIDRVQGLTSLNSDSRSATRLTGDTFIVNGLLPDDLGSQTYRSGSSDYVQCLELGCQFYKFTNYSNATRIAEVSTCVSERIGASAYSETSPTVSPVGLAYPGDDNPCLSSKILPLTDDKDALTRAINGYSAVGSTAGQIGVEWGWYMVSPRFGSIFPTDNQPEAYEADKRLKVVILMTDGEFNTPYCDGVVAGAVSGSGDTRYHISCPQYSGVLKNQPSGRYTNPFARSVETCKAMKAAGVVVYTVGFDVDSGSGGAGVDTAKEVMEQCATSSRYVYLPKTGSSLRSAFGEIARSIGQLRISR